MSRGNLESHLQISHPPPSRLPSLLVYLSRIPIQRRQKNPCPILSFDSFQPLNPVPLPKGLFLFGFNYFSIQIPDSHFFRIPFFVILPFCFNRPLPPLQNLKDLKSRIDPPKISKLLSLSKIPLQANPHPSKGSGHKKISSSGFVSEHFSPPHHSMTPSLPPHLHAPQICYLNFPLPPLTPLTNHSNSHVDALSSHSRTKSVEREAKRP